MAWIPCFESIKKIKERFDRSQVGGPLTRLKGKETGNAAEILFGEIGNEAGFLLAQSTKGSEEIKSLMKQQIAIDILQEEIPGTLNSFAVKRAEALARSNEKIIGAKGVRSIVKMRNIFEGAIYIVFPLILIFALIPYWGMKALINWLQFVLWISVWPPFYVAINFFISGDWKFNLSKKFGAKTVDLTLFTSSGLADLYSSMETTAAVALFFIPFLSWAIMKGGVGSMVHLASSLSAADQSSASVAAQEQSSGNYAFGQTSFDCKSLYNDSRHKQDLSGQMRRGSVSLSDGMTDTSYAPGEGRFAMNQVRSQLRGVDLSQSEALSKSLQNQVNHSESFTEEKSYALSDSIAKTANSAAGFVESLSENTQLGSHLSQQELVSWQKLTSSTQSQLEDYCQTWGVDRRQAMEEVVKASVGLPIIGGTGVSGSQSVGKLSGDQLAQRVSEAQNLSKNLSELSQYSTSNVINDSASKDARSHLDFTESWNQTQNEAEQFRVAVANQEAWSEILSGVQSNNLSIGENLNDRFVNYLMGTHNYDPKETQRILDHVESPESRQAIESFIQKEINPLDLLSSAAPEQIQLQQSNLNDKYAEEFSRYKQVGLSSDAEQAFKQAESQVKKPLDRELIRNEVEAFDHNLSSSKQLFEKGKEQVIPPSEKTSFQEFDAQKIQSQKEKIEQGTKEKGLISHAGEHLAVGKVASAIFSQKQYFLDLENKGLTEEQKIAIIDSRTADYFP